jgi:hypothetical protein
MTTMGRAAWLFAAAISGVCQCVVAQEDSLPWPASPNTGEILRGPSEDLLRQEMAPLSSQLPNTAPRAGLLPPDASEGLFDRRPEPPDHFPRGDWHRQQVHWAASELRHRPVYFEDTMLERHGQTRRPAVQTAVSGARFFATFPLLPYAMTVQPPRSAVSTLGNFRSGSPVPVLCQRPPLQVDAGLIESGAVVGLIFLIP